MIYINKNTSNNVILALTESSSLLDPNYVFEFTNDLERNKVYFTASDISDYRNRYNRFTIIESGTTAVDLFNGVVNLVPSGFWTYNIYESSASTISISATTGTILDTGKVYVNGDDAETPSIYR